MKLLVAAMRELRYARQEAAAGEVGAARAHLALARVYLGKVHGEVLLAPTDNLYRRARQVQRIADDFARGLVERAIRPFNANRLQETTP